MCVCEYTVCVCVCVYPVCVFTLCVCLPHVCVYPVCVCTHPVVLLLGLAEELHDVNRTGPRAAIGPPRPRPLW